ncbi:glutamate ligase domain-containing protein [Nocardioides dilutus]
MTTARPLIGERYHLFGIAGRGMAPLALATRHLGASVTGCDRRGQEETDAALAAAGLDYEREHSETHVEPGVTFVATSVAPPDEPEILAAERAGGVLHRTDLLARVLAARPGAGVTGSHGKGTVTALAAAAMDAAGLDPLAIVGVTVPDLGGMVRLGAGPTVAEVDDSDLSLARVGTEVAVVTNLDDDHPHLPSSLSQAVAGVGGFVAQARRRVVLGPSPRSERLAAYAEAEVWRHGRDFSARTISTDAQGTRLALTGPDGTRVAALVRLLGPQTAANASLAFATAIALGADPEAAAAGLERIGTLRRRLEPMGVRDGVRVFDDFGAKHPACVRGGIETLRRHFPDVRIIAVFEAYGPYLARWGRRFARALSQADHVVVAPAVFSADYAAGARFDERWTDACTGAPVLVTGRAEAARTAMGLARPGDVVVSFAQIGTGRETARLALGQAAPQAGT